MELSNFEPLGLAEVTITLRASTDNFFADLASQSLEAEQVVEMAQQEQNDEESQEDIAEEEPAQSEPQEDSEGKPHLTVISGKLDQTESEPESQPLPEPKPSSS